MEAQSAMEKNLQECLGLGFWKDLNSCALAGRGFSFQLSREALGVSGFGWDRVEGSQVSGKSLIVHSDHLNVTKWLRPGSC